MGIIDASLCVALACVSATLLLLSRIHEALSADEGYLWYGVLRLKEGGWPHIEFRSYEPGRYVWCALFARFGGATLTTLRVATHAFYALGLFTALWALRLQGLGWLAVGLAAITLSAWAHPLHKLFEPALFMIAFASHLAWLCGPEPLTAAAAGVSVGLALFFGFNCFLYIGAAHAVLWCLMAVGGLDPSLATSWPWVVAGTLLGAAPFLACMLSPRFAASFLERRVWSILARGTANLPLPLPWPWRPPPSQFADLNTARQRGLQGVFLALVGVPGATCLCMPFLASAAPGRSGAAVAAAAALGAVTWHHAASRADPPHLAQAMAPLMLLLISSTALLPRAQAPVLVLLALGSLGLTWGIHPRVRRWSAPDAYRLLPLEGLAIWMPTGLCRLVEHISELSRDHLRERGSLLALPTLVALYPILGRACPVYDMFSVFPAPEHEQQRMLDAILRNDVRLAVISDAPLDGREDLRFSVTHPRVWQHLQQHMRPLPGDVLSADLHVFTAPGSAAPGASASGAGG